MKLSSYYAKDIGVIVGRFQVHELHEAHKALIEYVASRHRKVIIVLGVAPTLCTTRNPLDFASRQKMINFEYPSVSVMAVPDQRDDNVWSMNLDTRLREAHPVGNIILYGGRDSFIDHYSGQFRCEDLDLVLPQSISGSELRERVANDVMLSSDWRAGVIYATNNRFPTAYPTIDVVVFNPRQNTIAVVRKSGESGYRLIGGFVNPSDKCLEQTVRRETYEEAGIDIGGIEYVCSSIVDDWRYRNETDKIMTTVFTATYVSGRLRAGDDVSEALWFPLSELGPLDAPRVSMFVEEHREFVLKAYGTWLSQMKLSTKFSNELGVV